MEASSMHASAKREPSGGAAVSPTLKTVTSEALFDGAKEIVIVHQGQPYRLRITGQGKLLLTK